MERFAKWPHRRSIWACPPTVDKQLISALTAGAPVAARPVIRRVLASICNSPGFRRVICSTIASTARTARWLPVWLSRISSRARRGSSAGLVSKY